MGWVNPDLTASERKDAAASLTACLRDRANDSELQDHMQRCRGMRWEDDEPGVYHCDCGTVIRVSPHGVQ